MTVCLSPNGCAVSRESGPSRELLVGTIRGIVHFTRSGPAESWRETRRSLPDVHVSSILREPASGWLFAGGHGQGGLWASADGKTWIPRMNGIDERHVFHVSAREISGNAVLYAGVEPANLYRSYDLGKTWELIPALTDVPGTDKWSFPPPPHLAHAKNVSWHPSDPGTFYVCVEQGALLKTTDDGGFFRELSDYESDDDLFYHDVHRIVIRERDPRQMFLTGGEGVHYSDDAGETWQHVQTRHDRLGYPDALVIDPHDEDVVFAAGAGDPPRTWVDQDRGAADAAVIRSDDGGRTWREVTNGLPRPLRGNIEAMSMHAHDDGIELFIGTATGEVYASADRGGCWTQVAAGLPPVSKVHHYRWFLPPAERARIEEQARLGR